MTAPVELDEPSYRTLLLGMKGQRSYTFRIIASSGATTCTSEDFSFRGALAERQRPRDVLPAGVIQEITPDGSVVQSFAHLSFGYADFRTSLYGPPPR